MESILKNMDEQLLRKRFSQVKKDFVVSQYKFYAALMKIPELLPLELYVLVKIWWIIFRVGLKINSPLHIC